MALILPKGIVVNSPEAVESLERIAAEPLDEAEIARYWKVYTTTQRRLLDPTAERLENYWWRIWGSRSKELKAATVARLFAHISEGVSFVPLRGPPNRDEGTAPPLRPVNRKGTGASSTTALHQAQPSRAGMNPSSMNSRSQAPMPHPILKKTRGPSSTGPRPTARFISPHESQDENEPTSSISPNSHVVVQPPSPDPESSKPEKKVASVPAKKKGAFVASTKKKRPVIVRRQSSQTSQSSAENIARQADASAIQSSSERTPPTFSEQARGKTRSRFQESFSPASSSSNQSPRKRIPRLPESKKALLRGHIARTPPETLIGLAQALNESGDPGPSTQRFRRIEDVAEEVLNTVTLDPEEREEMEVQRILLQQAQAQARKHKEAAAQARSDDTAEESPTMQSSQRSRSGGNHDPATIRLLHSDSKGVASLAPTLTAATGKVDLGNVGAIEPEQPIRNVSFRTNEKGKGRASKQSENDEIFAKRTVLAPTSDSPQPSSLLSRSKSQLTLLLERDRARSDDHKSDKDKDKSKGKKR